MKAYVLKNIGDISLEEVKDPALDGSGICDHHGRLTTSDENCVIVKVRAAGICGSDIPRIYKNGAYRHPMIPGHEFSGEVVAVGEKVTPRWMDRRVGVFPLIPCGKCNSCLKQKYEMCTDYNYLGSRCDGGFAEYVKVPADNLIELPDIVSFEQAAMLEPLSVALHAIKKCGFGTGSTIPKDSCIVICGLGTIGMCILMLLKSMGYENILCIGNKNYQKEVIVGDLISADDYADYNNDPLYEFVMRRTGSLGADVFFECVGKNESVSLGLNILAPSGHLQLVGNPASDMTFSRDEYWKILRRQLTITGTWNSSFGNIGISDWHEVLKKLSWRIINPDRFITHGFSLVNLYKGFEIMRDKTEDYIKVMCIF